MQTTDTAIWPHDRKHAVIGENGRVWMQTNDAGRAEQTAEELRHEGVRVRVESALFHARDAS
jgi:hypothetical protein